MTNDGDFRDEYDPLQPNNDYLYAFEGYIRPGAGEGGDYRFDFNGTDDRSALFIDLNGNGVFDDGTTLDPGERIINDSGATSGSIPLMEGVSYRVLVIHKEFTGGLHVGVPGTSRREAH